MLVRFFGHILILALRVQHPDWELAAPGRGCRRDVIRISAATWNFCFALIAGEDALGPVYDLESIAKNLTCWSPNQRLW